MKVDENFYLNTSAVERIVPQQEECRALSINSRLFTNWISTGTMTSPHPYTMMLEGWFLNSVQQCRVWAEIWLCKVARVNRYEL